MMSRNFRYGAVGSAVVILWGALLWLSFSAVGAAPTTLTESTPSETPTGTFPPIRMDYPMAAATQTAFAPNALLRVDLISAAEIGAPAVDAILSGDQNHWFVRAQGRIFVFSLADSKPPHEALTAPNLILDQGRPLNGMVLNTTGTRLASWSDADETNLYMLVRVWDTQSGVLLQEIEIRDDRRFYSSNGARWDQSGTRLLIWSRAGQVEVWDTLTGKQTLTLKQSRIAWGAAWNAAETRILVWTTDYGVRLYDAQSGTYLVTLGHRNAALNAGWSADDQYLLSASMDMVAGIWDGQTGEPRALFYHEGYQEGTSNPAAGIWSVAWSHDHERLFTGTLNGKVNAWVTDLDASSLGKAYTKPFRVLEAGSPVTQLVTNGLGNRVFIRAKGTQLWDGLSPDPIFSSSLPGVVNPSLTFFAVWDEYAASVRSVIHGEVMAWISHPQQDLALKQVVWLDDLTLLTATENGSVRVWRLGNVPKWVSQPLAVPILPTAIPEAPPPPINEGRITRRSSLKGSASYGQTFAAAEPEIRSIEVLLEPTGVFGSEVSLTLKNQSGQILGEQRRYITPPVGFWVPFTFDPPIPVVPGDIYRIEIQGSSEGGISLGFTNQNYLPGFAYFREFFNDAPVTTYHILYDMQFKVNRSSLSELHALETRIAEVATNIPPSKTAFSIAAAATKQQFDLEITATAAALSTRGAILKVTPYEVAMLHIGLANNLSDQFEAQPGESLDFEVGVTECCYLFRVMDQLKVHWSISPTEGAEINPETGRFHVFDTTSSGSVYRIEALLADGSVLNHWVHVYTPTANPLVGTWREDAQIACADGSWVKAPRPIQELIFHASGSLSVTWYPFEVYFDYGGTYQFNLQSGQFSFSPTEINYLPRQLSTQGKFRLDEQGRLILEGIWLGVPPDEQSQVLGCGHRFVYIGRSYR